MLLLAHVDTVFARDVPHEPRLEGDRLRGPGIGDNAAAVVCAVHVVERARARARRRGPRGRVHGRRGRARQPRRRARRLRGRCSPSRSWRSRATGSLHVAVDAVGSLRARITVRGPGGHSWANRGRPSAIDEICRIARALSRPAAARRQHEHRPDRGRHGGQRDRRPTPSCDRAARARRVACWRASRVRCSCSSVEPPLDPRGRGARPAPGRAARPPPAAARDRARACARSSGCRTSWSPPRPTPTPRSPPASRRSASAARRAARCTRPTSSSRSARWPRAASSCGGCSWPCSGTIRRP